MALTNDTYTLREVYTYAGMETVEGTYLNLEQSADQPVTPGAIATAEAIYAPRMALLVQPGVIGSGELVQAVSAVIQQVLPGTIATAASVPQPATTRSVAPNAIPTAESVPGPMLAATVLPGTIATAASVPSVNVVQVGPQTISPDTIISAPSVASPQVNTAVVPAAIPTAASVPAVNVQRSIIPDPIFERDQVYAVALVEFLPRWCPPSLQPAPQVPVAPILSRAHPVPPPGLVRASKTPAPSLSAATRRTAPALARAPRSSAPPLREVKLCRP